MAPPFLALICYEAVFSGDLGRETDQAAYILNITNDAWFDGSVGLAQHADHVKLRAVEEGLPLIRVANSGLTEVVDPLGRVTQNLPQEQIGVLDVVPANRLDATIFTRLGYWPLLAALLGGLAIAVWSSRSAPVCRPVEPRACTFRNIALLDLGYQAFFISRLTGPGFAVRNPTERFISGRILQSGVFEWRAPPIFSLPNP